MNKFKKQLIQLIDKLRMNKFEKQLVQLIDKIDVVLVDKTGNARMILKNGKQYYRLGVSKTLKEAYLQDVTDDVIELYGRHIEMAYD